MEDFLAEAGVPLTSPGAASAASPSALASAASSEAAGFSASTPVGFSIASEQRNGGQRAVAQKMSVSISKRAVEKIGAVAIINQAMLTSRLRGSFVLWFGLLVLGDGRCCSGRGHGGVFSHDEKMIDVLEVEKQLRMVGVRASRGERCGEERESESRRVAKGGTSERVWERKTTMTPQLRKLQFCAFLAGQFLIFFY